MSDRPPSRRRRGHDIESLTAQWLTRQGLVLIERNYHARTGEIDLIMRDGEFLVFVEVRFRAQHHHGSALETITAPKQRRLVRAAHFYLQSRRLSCACRFDAVGVSGQPPDRLEFEWIRSAFDAF